MPLKVAEGSPTWMKSGLNFTKDDLMKHSVINTYLSEVKGQLEPKENITGIGCKTKWLRARLLGEISQLGTNMIPVIHWNLALDPGWDQHFSSCVVCPRRTRWLLDVFFSSGQNMWQAEAMICHRSSLPGKKKNVSETNKPMSADVNNDSPPKHQRRKHDVTSCSCSRWLWSEM